MNEKHIVNKIKAISAKSDFNDENLKNISGFQTMPLILLINIVAVFFILVAAYFQIVRPEIMTPLIFVLFVVWTGLVWFVSIFAKINGANTLFDNNYLVPFLGLYSNRDILFPNIGYKEKLISNNLEYRREKEELFNLILEQPYLGINFEIKKMLLPNEYNIYKDVILRQIEQYKSTI